MKNIKAKYIGKLAAQIEENLNWGKSNFWTQRDFEKLTELIFHKTGNQISVTTLKRVMGKIGSDGNPSMVTLDILSGFLSYQDWREFIKVNGPKSDPFKRKKFPVLLILPLATIGILIYLGFVYYEKDKDLMIDEDVIFSFEKVTKGYPNTVIFNYDIGSSEYDSISIQQSWDSRKRIKLDSPQGVITSTYYVPGYFLTKLIINDSIIQEKELYISSLGWQGLIQNPKGDIQYLRSESISLEVKTLKIDDNIISELKKEEGRLYLCNLIDNPTIDGSSFMFHTKFRIVTPLDNTICHNMKMIITGTREVYSLGFSIPGCVGDLNFYIDEKIISGRKIDLQGFGIEREKWIDCEVVVEDRNFKVYIENMMVYSQPLRHQIGNIGGIQWWFEGIPEIARAEISDGYGRTLNFLERSQ